MAFDGGLGVRMAGPNTQSTPLALRAYHLAGRLFPGFWNAVARRVHAKQGSAPERLQERFGKSTSPRPGGTLLWFHATSVGELVSVLDLGRQLAQESGASLLFTTITRTAADIAVQRMPKGAIHQFLPVDTPAAVSEFLDHWQPDLAVIVESDMWPALVVETAHRQIPLVLANARASRSRRRAPGLAGWLLGHFDCITTQDSKTRQDLIELGLDQARVQFLGDLKSAASPLPADEKVLAEIHASFGARPIWVAASTHAGEEEMVAEAHRTACETHSDLLLVLMPRHADRGPAVRDMLLSKGFRTELRSGGGLPGAKTEIYLADTIGETGVFYRLAPLVFLGGSFTPKGGHNPFEPALLGAAVLHGPGVANFTSAYADLDAAGAARCVEDAQDLGRTVAELVESPDLEVMRSSARALMSERTAARSATLELLRALLARRDSGGS